MDGFQIVWAMCGLMSVAGGVGIVVGWKKSRERFMLISAIGAGLMSAFCVASILELSDWVRLPMIFLAAAANCYGAYLVSRHGKAFENDDRSSVN